MTDFREGDRVKVEFEGVVGELFNPNDIDFHGWVGVNRQPIQPRHITLIERAKPKLKIGQVWESKQGIRREITNKRGNKLAYWVDVTFVNSKDEYFGGSSTEHFFKHYAHKLINEGHNG